MISIKKLLESSETTIALVRVLHLLLQGIGLHAVEADTEELAAFRGTLERASSVLEEGSSSDYLIQAGIVLKALEDYNRGATKSFRQQGGELQAMVRMLTRTVESISAASQDNVYRLKQIEGQIVSATQIDDVRMLRAKLGECLTEIRSEAERQRAFGHRALEEGQQGIQQVSRGVRAEPLDTSTDPVTGLPARAAAELALAGATRNETPACIAVLVVERIQIYNATFGLEVGDQVLRNSAGFIRRQLREGDQVFRWTGPAQVILVTRPDRIENVRDEIKGLLVHKFEHTVNTAARKIHLPISARCTVLPMMAAPRLLHQKIDTFVASPNTAA